MATFRELAGLCERLSQTRSRRELARQVADFLGGLEPEEVRPAVRLLLGEAGHGGAVSGQTLWPVLLRIAGAAAPPDVWAGAVDFGEAVERLLAGRATPPELPALGLVEVEERVRALAAARGAGSRAEKKRLLADLFERLTPLEAKYVAKNLIREMRTGAAEGILLDALALIAGGDRAAVARAHMLEGDLTTVATLVLAHRGGPLPASTLAYFRPLRPMLAHTAESVTAALGTFGGRAGVEWKLDGARVQVHRRGDECRLYSRRLQDLTASLPDVVAEIGRGLAAPAAILEGEVIAVDGAGRALPFQELMRRFRRIRDVGRIEREVPVRLYLFDALQAGDEPLIDRPYAERWAALERLRGALPAVARLVPAATAEGEAFSAAALADGFEGVMVKGLDAPYTPGVRGRGWLSNYHLAARDERTGRLEPVGKTFKGLTDAEFRAMTERLSALAIREEGPTVHVEPRIVVEVLFGDLQRSPTYPAGVALRFARIARVRDDKAPADADTVQHLHALLARQQAGAGGQG